MTSNRSRTSISYAWGGHKGIKARFTNKDTTTTTTKDPDLQKNGEETKSEEKKKKYQERIQLRMCGNIYIYCYTFRVNQTERKQENEKEKNERKQERMTWKIKNHMLYKHLRTSCRSTEHSLATLAQAVGCSLTQWSRSSSQSTSAENVLVDDLMKNVSSCLVLFFLGKTC